MKIKQIYKIMELIDEKLEALTIEEYVDYGYGEGTLTILENAIDEVLWDKDSIEQFWKTYQSTTYDETPYENNVVYSILEKYFFARIASIHQKFCKQED